MRLRSLGSGRIVERWSIHGRTEGGGLFFVRVAAEDAAVGARIARILRARLREFVPATSEVTPPVKRPAVAERCGCGAVTAEGRAFCAACVCVFCDGSGAVLGATCQLCQGEGER